MHPLVTILHFGPHALPVGSYGVLLALAIAVAATAALRSARALGIELGAAIATSGIVTASAFAGGFALHALVQLARHRSLDAALAQPGMTIAGALPAAALGLWLAARALALPALRWTAHALPGLLVAIAIGRVGCLLGGCCYGTPCELPWSVRYEDPLAPAALLDVARHPAPAYEALCVLLLAAALAGTPRGTPLQRVSAGLLGYALIRSLLELVRGDELRGVWALGLTTAQLVCAAAAAAWLAWARTEGARPSRDGV